MNDPQTSVVSTTRSGDVLVVTIDHPPVNAGTGAVRQGLAAALSAAAADPTLVGVVLTGAGSNFMAGSDLNEFDGPIPDPSMPAVIALVEACPVPVVAALRGAALGGGLELALGCDRRVAAPGTVVGLPEVGLGILPGAGATVRLPRLVGPARALALIGEATRLTAEEALTLGIVDEVVSGDLVAAASSWAVAHGVKRRVRDLPVPPADPVELDAVEAAVLRSAGDRPHVRAAIAAVRRAGDLPVDDALARERAAFHELRTTEEAAALRHLFFAERRADQRIRQAARASRPVERVVVVGAGTMGAAIAWTAAAAGFDVVLTDTDETLARAGRDRIVATAGRRLDAATVAAVLDRFHTAGGLTPAAAADLVIEAVFEDLAVKEDVFCRLDEVARPGAVLATNTSYLDVDRIAAATGRPEDVVGMHFFAPAHVMKLLEVVDAARTSETTLATAVAVGGRMGKVPVVAGVADGFIGNRVFAAYRRQCELVLEEGAYPEDVDAAMQEFGFAMGPFAVADLSGLDISWRNRQRLAPGRDPRERYVVVADQLCEAGRLGQKTGAGWYRYEDGRTPLVDPEVRALIDAASTERGIERRAFSSRELLDRAVLAMVNEALLVLAEGIAASPDDIDLVLVHGFGFPRHRGGPLWWASRQDSAQMAAGLDDLGRATGFGFRHADLGLLARPTPHD